MKTILQYKTIKWLVLSSLMAGALTACPDAGGTASFEVTGTSLGTTFVDGTQIQPAEAIVKNISSTAGMPPQVSFNVSSDLEFLSLESSLYACDQTSEVLLTCTAKDGAKLEGQTQTSLKPLFDLVYKNVDAPTALQARTHLLNLPISINSAVLINPVVLAASTVTAAASGFDLIIDKTVSKPFVVDGSGNGSGEFTITASLANSTPLPSYVKIQDPPLPVGYTYDLASIIAANPAYNCLVTSLGFLSCNLKPAFVAAGAPYPPLKVTVKVTGLTNLSTQQNCPWLYPLLGDTVNNNNHLGPAPYAKPCTKYQPTKTDLAITKTQIAPLTTPANSFYWGLPGKYQIVVSNTTGFAANGPITVSDVLTNIPTTAVLAFTPTLASIFLASDGWTIVGTTATNANGWVCTGVYPNITCTHPGPVPANGSLPPLILGVQVKPENPALAQGETNCASLVNTSPVGVPTPIAYNDANNQNNKSCIDSQNMALEPFDVAITKKHLNTSVTPGGVVNYALNVQNIGAGDAPGPIVVTDTLPAAFSSTPTPTWSVTPASAATCTTVAFPTITCTSSGSLPAGASFVININATTNSNAPLDVVNKATVSSYLNSSDSNLQNNTSSDVLVLTSPINLHHAESVVQAANGDFIVVGSSDSVTLGKQFLVRRYDPTGTSVICQDEQSFSAANDSAMDVALDSAGNIVVVGYAHLIATTDMQAVLMKYTPSCTVMSGFPVYVGTQTDGNYDTFTSVAIDRNDRIVTGGFDNRTPAVRDRFVVHRFNSNGISDNTFGTAGRVETDVMSVLGLSSFSQGVNDVLIEESSSSYRIYAGGVIRPGGTITAIARYDVSGNLDNSWGGVGAIQTNIPSTGGNQLYEMGLQTIKTAAGLETFLVGTGTQCVNDCVGETDPNKSCFVIRYDLTAGAIDTSFGSSSGITSFGAANATDGKTCTGISINKNTNEIAVGGSTYKSSNGLDYMAGILNANGVLGSLILYGSNNPNFYSSLPAVAPRADAGWGITWTVSGKIMTVGYSDQNATNKDEWVVKQYP